jgi:serine/threonine-protein kinase
MVTVRDGQKVRVEIIGPYGKFPDWTTFDGHLYVGERRVYGRFTAAHVPNGETVPVCMEVMTIGESARGAAAEPGSTPTQALTISSMSAQVVERFK